MREVTLVKSRDTGDEILKNVETTTKTLELMGLKKLPLLVCDVTMKTTYLTLHGEKVEYCKWYVPM